MHPPTCRRRDRRGACPGVACATRSGSRGARGLGRRADRRPPRSDLVAVRQAERRDVQQGRARDRQRDRGRVRLAAGPGCRDRVARLRRDQAGRRAGRATLRARAIPRLPADGFDAPLWRLGAMGADELHLDVDAERGTLLRIESRFRAAPLAISEILEIAFDEQFPDETFVFTPPAGEEVRSVSAQFAVRRDLTIEQAVALAPFAVWMPARLPAGWETQIGFAAAQDRPPSAAHVFLHYRAPDGTHGLSIAESPASEPGTGSRRTRRALASDRPQWSTDGHPRAGGELARRAGAPRARRHADPRPVHGPRGRGARGSRRRARAGTRRTSEARLLEGPTCRAPQ